MLARAALCHIRQTGQLRVISRDGPIANPSVRPPTRVSCEHRFSSPLARSFASLRSADEVMENLQELYATAKDEFEMAAEETERKTVYASDDRDAAKDALQQLKDAYGRAIENSTLEVAKEIQNRVSQRLRELENANAALQESAQEH